MVFFMVSAAMNHTSGGNPHPGLSFLQFCFFMVSITCVFFLFPNLCLQDRIRTEFPIGDGIIATSACVNYFLVWNS